MNIVFATNNKHKLEEIRSILGDSIEVLSLKDIGCDVDIPETGTTLEENALQKAQYVFDHYHMDCFADDTGLEVEALNGAPGVYSARYAGDGHDSEANMTKLLHELEGIDNRKARFRTVIALIRKRNVCPCGCTSVDVTNRFEGIVEGEIIRERKGTTGFGYDPIFQPEGYSETFAELGSDIKNKISHRARAVAKLSDFLKTSLFFILFSLLFSPVRAQIGSWRAYMAYSEPQQIVKASDNLFVRASNDLFLYNLNDHSITTYDKVNGLSDTYIDKIGWNDKVKKLIIIYQNSNIDLLDLNDNVTNISAIYRKAMTADKTVDSLTFDGINAYLYARFGIVKVNMERGEISETYTSQHPEYPTGLPSSTINSDYDKYIEIVRTLRPDGPQYNHFYESKCVNGSLYTVAGYFLSGKGDLDYPGIVQVWNGTEWQNYQERLDTVTGYAYMDNNCIDVDPTDNSHVAVGGRCGLYEFKNGKLLKYHNQQNSPLHGAMDGSTELDNSYTLVNGIKYDKEGNLWVLNSQSKGVNLLQLTKDGEWTDHYQKELADNSGIALVGMRDVIFDSHGRMWFVNSNWRSPALICYDVDNDKLIKYSNFTNQDGVAYVVTSVNSVCEDLEGNIWVGTNQGPFMLNSNEAGSDNATFQQIKVPRNDGSDYADYLLSGVNISSIAIDGGNRKWFGTDGAGVFLVSADNMEQLQYFTEEKTNLLSDRIMSVSINNQTGEVFFLTDKGVCSYLSDATESAPEMTNDNVYAYPNPVTPDFTGLITIKGLSLNADVKICSSSGKIIAEGRSNGGLFTWDGNDKDGRRVASGVYMVMTATSDGKKGAVCKIAIIR